MYGGITNRQKSSLRELVYYCTEPEPVGALMFTGEWGCGKTYLIDHELKATFDGQNGREEKVIISGLFIWSVLGREYSFACERKLDGSVL